MFPSLIMGKPKEGMYEKSLEGIKELLGNHLPTINVSEVKWVDMNDPDGKYLGYGSYGHITGVEIQMVDGDDRYSFYLIFNYLPETEKLDDKIEKVLGETDWKTSAMKWNIGNL